MNNGTTPKLRTYTLKDLDTLPELQRLPAEHRQAMRVIAHVLPFRSNNYVVEQLIDWSDIPHDPLFQLTFPQPGMLSPEHFARMSRALVSGAIPEKVRRVADGIRMELNPHPEGQMAHNVPRFEDEPVEGAQHKYAQTCLVFPSPGQTCQAYCTFCFRWAQFVGIDELKFATDESMRFREYLQARKEVTDVLITGGDPMVMKASVLARYIEPLLAPELRHVQTIRIGTKSLSYWPYRYLTDPDSDQLLRLLERVVSAGKHLAIMAHFSHGRELEPEPAQQAIRRLQSLGAVIRSQSPLLRHINDDAEVWSGMWNQQVKLGCVPYYMFVERETGARGYFKVPLYRALEIYREAIATCSGLARTARGPTMSALPGKVIVEGVAEIQGEEVFVLSFLQARDPDWCKRPFFARFNPEACWLTDLRPAFGQEEFFYQGPLRALLRQPSRLELSSSSANGHHRC